MQWKGVDTGSQFAHPVIQGALPLAEKLIQEKRD